MMTWKSRFTLAAITIFLSILCFMLGGNFYNKFLWDAIESHITPQLRINRTDSLKKVIVEDGDEGALKEFIKCNLPEYEKISLALIMANRHNNAYASYEVYRGFSGLCDFNKNDVEKDKNFIIAIHYITKAARLDSAAYSSELDSLKKTRPKYFIGLR